MMNICIVGSGHVGLVTGACLADLGNQVICMDDDKSKIASLLKGHIPFYEPELESVVQRTVSAGRLSFTTDAAEGVLKAKVIFICVGTPQGPDGAADLSYVETAAKRVAEAMDGYRAIVDKSTVPVKTGGWVKRTVELNNRRQYDFDVVSNPEFLREGKAVHDFMHPDRIVIGVESERAAQLMKELYQPFKAPMIVTNIETAELIKHASNAFLAVKISYINAIANICEAVGADVTKVAEGMGLDERIGRAFLDAGIGYGGYCLPKDVLAFIKIAEEVGYDFDLLRAVNRINDHQSRLVVRKAKDLLWNLNNKTIGVLGLAFKPETDDIREAPSIKVIKQLQQEGVKIKAYDPKAMDNIRQIFPDIELCQGPYQVAEGSDALVIVTDWDEFKKMDLRKIKGLLNQPVIIDGRNMFDPDEMAKLGFTYQGVGR
jgi:UDPglucose 6-dehydrogenase